MRKAHNLMVNIGYKQYLLLCCFPFDHPRSPEKCDLLPYQVSGLSVLSLGLGVTAAVPIMIVSALNYAFPQPPVIELEL
jgi:hypothetical protein